MAKYLVTYDLVDGRDYDRIINELDRLGAVRTQKSVYLVSRSTDSAAGFLQYLKAYVDEDDRLMVVKMTEEPEWTKGFKGTSAWIAKNFG